MFSTARANICMIQGCLILQCHSAVPGSEMIEGISTTGKIVLGRSMIIQKEYQR